MKANPREARWYNMLSLMREFHRPYKELVEMEIEHPWMMDFFKSFLSREGYYLRNKKK
jgi:hypothetical protein